MEKAKAGFIISGSLCVVLCILGATLMGVSDPPTPQNGTFVAGFVLLAIAACIFIAVIFPFLVWLQFHSVDN